MVHADVILHPGPAGEPASEDFAVCIDGQPLFVYQARVSAVPLNQLWPGYQRPLDQTELASFAYWDMGRPVSVEVVSRRPIDSVVIRPLSLQIEPTLDNNRIRFSLDRPVYLTVEVNGYHQALHLFASPPEEHTPDPGDPTVRYFGPGIHRPGLIELHSGETVYLAGGAVVHGAITAREAQDIRVLGRGILDLSGYERDGAVWGAFSCYHCADVVVDGIVMRDPPGWTLNPSASRNIRLANFKLIGLWRYNSDGIDLVNCRHVRIDRCFVRAFDDCIALKGLNGRKDAVTDDQNLGLAGGLGLALIGLAFAAGYGVRQQRHRRRSERALAREMAAELQTAHDLQSLWRPTPWGSARVRCTRPSRSTSSLATT